MKTILLVVTFLLSFSLYAQIAPTGTSPQTFCSNQNPTLASVVVQGDNLVWYDAVTDGNVLPLSTALLHNTTYWVAQGTAPEAERLPILVYINPYIPAPYGDSTLYLCTEDNNTLMDIPVFNSTGYNGIYWFADPNLQTQLSPNHLIENGITYYATQGLICADVLPLTVVLFPPIPQPFGYVNEKYCANENLTLENAYLFNTIGWDNIYWYANIEQTGPLDPSITTLEDGITYYAFQGIGACSYSQAITFHAETEIPAPLGANNQNLMVDETINFLDADVYNTSGFTNLYWYADANQNVAIHPYSTVGSGTYYVFQGIGSCAESLAVTFGYNMAVEEIPISWIGIYPNPVNDLLHLNLYEETSDLDVKIYNLQGQLVFEKLYLSPIQQVQISIQHQASGLYFIEINSDTHTQFSKFIKE